MTKCTGRLIARILLASALVVLVGMPLLAGGAQEGKAAAAGETIHLALSAPLTGDWSEYGINFQRSAEMAIAALNEKGGVLGKKLRLSVGDTKGNPTEAATLAQKWTSDSSIVAQIGAFSSSSSMAAQPIFDQAGMVQLSPTASHTQFASGSPWSFGIVGVQAAEQPYMARFAYNDLGIRKIAILHLNNDWGIDTAKFFKAAFEELGGKIVGTEFYFDGESDFTAVLTKLKQTDAEALFMASFYNDGAAINIQRDRIGWDVKVLGPSSLYSPQLVKLGGKAVEGLYTNQTFFAKDPDPRVQSYVKGFEAKYGATPNMHAALAYDAVMLLADAMQRANSTDRKAIRDALAKTTAYPGLAGEITFTEAGDVRKAYKILQVQNGEFVVWKK